MLSATISESVSEANPDPALNSDIVLLHSWYRTFVPCVGLLFIETDALGRDNVGSISGVTTFT